MKYISLLNPITIKYLMNNPNTRYFIINLLNKLLNKKENYRLLDFFSNEEKVRSYLFFENSSEIIFIDFNLNLNASQLDDDKYIIKFLDISQKKSVKFIFFINVAGKNLFKENEIILFKNPFETNEYLKLMFASNYKNQVETKFDDILDYLYNLDDNFQKMYQKELNHLYNYY